MGRLNQVIKELQRVLDKKTWYMRLPLKKLVKENDSSALEHKASYATDGTNRKPYPTRKEAALRKEHPGLYDVIFINKHNKQRQVLTLEDGITYDIAMHYYNYITDYGTERCTEVGHYEIVPHKPHFLPAEDFTGF